MKLIYIYIIIIIEYFELKYLYMHITFFCKLESYLYFCYSLLLIIISCKLLRNNKIVIKINISFLH